MRVLFFNEGNLGHQIMGQGQLEAALRVGLPGIADVSAHFAGLAPMGRLARTATRELPLLTKASLDFGASRWHVVQSLRARSALRRELRAWPADVVHVHSHSVAFAMGHTMAALPVALSLDTTVRDWWEMPAWRPPSYAAATIAASCALERRALNRAALVLAWTAWARRAVERSAPQAHVVEHHPGIDLERYRPLARSARERPRVLFVGGRFERKGGEDLLAALGDDLGVTVDLDIVTPAAVRERPGVRVHRLGPSDPELLRLQQDADVFCLPTKGDAAPWAVLEAMACGTPVLGTRIGGIPDLLDGGRAGVLVPHSDRRTLAEGLRGLLESPQRRAELAASARARCELRYDAGVQTGRMAELLRKLLVA
jgi:glycosyltransferase involved in cell wall biosynthesis